MKKTNPDYMGIVPQWPDRLDNEDEEGQEKVEKEN